MSSFRGIVFNHIYFSQNQDLATKFTLRHEYHSFFPMYDPETEIESALEYRVGMYIHIIHVQLND